MALTESRRVLVRDMGAEAGRRSSARGHLVATLLPPPAIRLPKGGPTASSWPDGCAATTLAPTSCWELVLYALPPALDEFPSELFFDDDIVWHQQHFGLPGHVATASLVERGGDLVRAERSSPTSSSASAGAAISRRGSRTASRAGRGCSCTPRSTSPSTGVPPGAASPRAELALAAHRPGRVSQRPLFDRVYDRSVGPPFEAVRDGHWWVLDVAAQRRRCSCAPTVGTLALSDEPQVCVCHDIERGWGHLDEDPAFAAPADVEPRATRSTRMLEVEAERRRAGDVLHPRVPRAGARRRGARPAATASASTRSTTPAPASRAPTTSSARAATVDYRIKGYRPAQSRLTAELTDDNLAFHNFEWLASSRYSLGHRPTRCSPTASFASRSCSTTSTCTAARRTTTGRPPGWRRWPALRTAAFSLHDCYGSDVAGGLPGAPAQAGRPRPAPHPRRGRRRCAARPRGLSVTYRYSERGGAPTRRAARPACRRGGPTGGGRPARRRRRAPT